jgi:DNA-binding XRE family transcriptional regulator
MATKPRWRRSGFFRLDAVEYQPEERLVRVRFGNGDVGEVAAAVLWRDRPGKPDWPKVRIDPDTCGALQVPTLPGHPTREGELAELPGDVIRAAADVDYRAHVARRAATWARRVGREVARLREERGWTQREAGKAAGVEEWRIAGVESGRIETSLAVIERILKALGSSLQDLKATARR